MADYKRFVSYLYQYEDDNKKNSIGYARVENRSGQCKVFIHLANPAWENRLLKAYMFYRNSLRYRFAYLGSILVTNGVGELKAKSDCDNVMNSNLKLDDLTGIVVYQDRRVFSACEWDDLPITYHITSYIENAEAAATTHETESSVLRAAEQRGPVNPPQGPAAPGGPRQVQPAPQPQSPQVPPPAVPVQPQQPLRGGQQPQRRQPMQPQQRPGMQPRQPEPQPFTRQAPQSGQPPMQQQPMQPQQPRQQVPPVQPQQRPGMQPRPMDPPPQSRQPQPQQPVAPGGPRSVQPAPRMQPLPQSQPVPPMSQPGMPGMSGQPGMPMEGMDQRQNIPRRDMEDPRQNPDQANTNQSEWIDSFAKNLQRLLGTMNSGNQSVAESPKTSQNIVKQPTVETVKKMEAVRNLPEEEIEEDEDSEVSGFYRNIRYHDEKETNTRTDDPDEKEINAALERVKENYDKDILDANYKFDEKVAMDECIKEVQEDADQLEKELSSVEDAAATVESEQQELDQLEQNLTESETSEEEDETLKQAMEDAAYVKDSYYNYNHSLKQELRLEAHPIAKNILNRFPKIYPFEDNEISDCVRIEPQDIGLLPIEAWVLGNNSFLLHGYYSYKHLIFGKINHPSGYTYVLGVPGIYHNRERFMAKMFGFNEFKCAKMTEQKDGEFGYWYTPIILN